VVLYRRRHFGRPGPGWIDPSQPMGLGPSLQPRVLCLHSHRMSGAIFREQLYEYSEFGPLLEEVGCELEFIDAPFRVNPEEVAKIPPEIKMAFEGHDDHFEWYNKAEDRTEDGGLYYSIAYLEKEMTERGPFDGIVGFSQGATMAQLAMVHQARGLAFRDHPALRFMILISGQLGDPDAHKELFTAPLTVPFPKSLVIYGGKDDVVPIAKSREFIGALPGAKTLYLPNQHHAVPRLTLAADAAKVRNFVEVSLAEEDNFA